MWTQTQSTMTSTEPGSALTRTICVDDDEGAEELDVEAEDAEDDDVNDDDSAPLVFLDLSFSMSRTKG